MPRVYMDANAATPLPPEVVEAMRPYWTEEFANANSIHLDGQRARTAVDRARETLAEFLHCREAEIVFNSGGTEGDNAAIRGLLNQGDHQIVSAIEHAAVLDTARRMNRHGVRISFVEPAADGRIDPEAIRARLKPETKLISVMLANNETGVLQPIAEIGQIAAEAGAFFHVDAVQGAGKIPIDVEALGCHTLAVSAHKMYGPKGVGALYVRRGTPLESLLTGGGQERRLRAGTLNVPGVVGFGKAVELAMRSFEDGSMERLAKLRDRLEAGLLKIPGTGVNGAGAPRTANTTNLWFDGLEGEALVIALDLNGVAVSGGSACHSGSTDPSHVLTAMGVDRTRALASLRFSLLKTATDADVDYVLQIAPETVERLRALAPSAAGTLG